MIDQINQSELRQCIEAFYFGYREFTAQPDCILASRGLNRAHHRILYFVEQNPNIRVGELLEILDVSKQALNIPLRQLIEMQLITSLPADYDRRIRCLNLTNKGRELEARLTKEQLKLLNAAFESFPDSTRCNWLAVMQSIAEK